MTLAECAFSTFAFNNGTASAVISSEIRSVAFQVADAPHTVPSASRKAVAVTVPNDFAPQSIWVSGPGTARAPHTRGTVVVVLGASVVVGGRVVVAFAAALPQEDRPARERSGAEPARTRANRGFLIPPRVSYPTFSATVFLTALPFLGVTVIVTRQVPGLSAFTDDPETLQTFTEPALTTTTTFAPDGTVPPDDLRIDVAPNSFPAFMEGELVAWTVVAWVAEVVVGALVVVGAVVAGTSEDCDTIDDELVGLTDTGTVVVVDVLLVVVTAARVTVSVYTDAVPEESLGSTLTFRVFEPSESGTGVVACPVATCVYVVPPSVE